MDTMFDSGVEELFARVENLEADMAKLKDHINFLENVEPYDPAKDEADLLQELVAENVYKEGWY